MWQKAHSHFLEVLSVSHKLQNCTKSTVIGTMKSGNKVTVRLSVGCRNAPILQHSGGRRAGRKHTQPTLRHKVPGINEIRNS